MSWICSHCSNSNSDTVDRCMLCGTRRSDAVAAPSRGRRVPEGKIVFSGFGVVKESILDFGRSVGRGVGSVISFIRGIGRRRRSSRDRRERASAESTATVSTRERLSEGSRSVEREGSRSIEREGSRDARRRETRESATVRGGEAAAERVRTVSREDTVFAEPWPEHTISFNAEVIRSRSFIRSERSEKSGIKGYIFYRADGSAQFMRMEMLVALRMAVRL